MNNGLSYFSWFQENYPNLIKLMKQCDHHYDSSNLNPYHLESDSWTHTNLVFYNAFKHDPNNIVLILSALLHDIGKLYTRFENHEKKRVSFIGHEGVSFFHAIEILNKLELPPGVKQTILSLISLHGSIYDFLNIEEISKKSIKEIYYLFKYDLHLFYFLLHQVYFDTQGRFYLPEIANKRQTEYCADELVNFYKNEFAKISIAEEVQLQEENKKDREAIFLVGLPCSGKSFYSLEHPSDYTIISRDKFVLELSKGKLYNEAFAAVDHKEVDRLLEQQKVRALKERQNIIVDMMNISRKSRRGILSRLPKNYKTKVIMFATPLNVVKERNLARKEKEGKFISDNLYLEMMQRFLVPLSGEFDEVKWIF